MTKSELKQIIKECVTELMSESDAGEICSKCKGSGEGMSDGTLCSKCGGSGDEDHPWGRKNQDNEEDPDDWRDRQYDKDTDRDKD